MPSQRLAARRKIVVEDEDDSDLESAQNGHDEEDEDDFVEEPVKKPRAAPRRRVSAEPTTPKRRTAGTRASSARESVEPSQLASPPRSVVAEPMSPTKSVAPTRRSAKDARAARQSRVARSSMASQADASMLTPAPSATPAPASRQETPQSDVTMTSLQEQTPRAKVKEEPISEEEPGTITEEEREGEEEEEKTIVAAADKQTEVTRIDPSITHLERPMDIVIRTRALGVPQTQAPSVPKQRLTITYLILTNFKSYAGRQQIGPFHASFSSVIGPNGSGKSNVIDSLLFVFGFRASKMRQGKISALIHNSAEHPDLDYCEVEVHFQELIDTPNGGHVVVENSQLIVSRRAFKNNSSKYYINGRESTFTVVTTLLRDKGIDLDHKRFLILQGEVESIAQMKPKATGEHDDGLLEYLEDIIGTSKYKVPIEEAAAETETLNGVCQEKSTRVQHVEKEKNGLESRKDKALAFIRDENELCSKQSTLYQIYVTECNDNIEVTEEANLQLQTQLDTETAKHKGRDSEIRRLEKQHKSDKAAYEKMEKSAQTIMKESAKLEKDAVKFDEKKKFLTSKAKKLEKSLDTSRFGISESLTTSKQATQDIERIANEISDLEEQMTTEERELAKIRESLRGKTQGLSDQVAAKQKQLEPWNTKIGEKKAAMALATSELEILRERQGAGAAAVAEVEAKILDLQKEKTAKEAQLVECRKEGQSAARNTQKALQDLESLRAKESALSAKVSGARSKANEARASLTAHQSQGNVLSSLMRLKDSGRITGFHGRLGNLGTIDARYDVAISTACSALNNLVVDTVDVGQQCIEYLRKNNLGRANFILLDRLPNRDLSAVKTPEDAPRLFDLVKSKEDRFRPAFYSVLQNTLVAKDLKQANRIAYGAQRWRVVTLDGQLIDKSGTMSGGGTKVSKGAMSAKLVAETSKEQVAKYEVDRDDLEKALRSLQDSMQESETHLSTLKKSIPDLETQEQKLRLELASLDRAIADADKRMQELSHNVRSSKTGAAQIRKLEDGVDDLQSSIEKLQSEMSGIEDEIKDLQDKIMQIGGVKLRAQKGKVDGLKEQIETLNETLNAAEVTKVKADKQHIKHTQTVKASEAEMQKISDDLSQVKQEADEHQQRSAGVRAQAEEAERALEDRRDEIAQIQSDLEALVAEMNETRKEELILRNKLEENQKILAENQKRHGYWNDKLGKLRIQVYTESGEEGEAEAPPELSRDELADFDKEELKASIAILEERTSQPVELAVLAEYRRRVNEHTSRLDDLNSALAARDVAKKRTDELRRLRLEGFMEGFSIISLRLKDMYQMITMGGNAELELVDSLDPFSEGILFSVMPPKKSWKNIANLSGGEKTLSSLALVFALHHYKPTPLYVMDEIDAALDFRNVSIVAAYIKERTKNAQFIVISLRNNMFEMAARLVGVYKVNHMTKSATIENKDYMKPNGQTSGRI